MQSAIMAELMPDLEGDLRLFIGLASLGAYDVERSASAISTAASLRCSSPVSSVWAQRVRLKNTTSNKGGHDAVIRVPHPAGPLEEA